MLGGVSGTCHPVMVKNLPEYSGLKERVYDQPVEKEHLTVAVKRLDDVMGGLGSLRYVKIDPLRLDNALISKTFSRPFVRHHVVIPIAQESEGLVIAVADPFDTTLRETLQDVLRRPFVYAVTSKRDILAVADRVFGLRSSIPGSSWLTRLTSIPSSLAVAEAATPVVAP